LCFYCLFVGDCAALGLRLPEDGATVLKHVADFKTYIQFLIQSCAFVGECALLQVFEITNTIHTFAPLLYSYMLAPTCFGNSLPSSGSFWICLSYVKIQIDMVVYHIMWLSGLCV
jgi:hypothetical protein